MTGKENPETTLQEAQERFAEEYLVDFNAAAAYQRAGYKAKGQAAFTNASRLLAKPKVQAYLAVRKKALVQRTELSIERCMQEIEAIAFSDPRQLFDELGALKNLNDIPDGIARAVSGFELGDKVKITLWDKLGAIEKALKLLNAYPERKQVAPSQTIVGVVIIPQKGGYQHPERPVAAIEGKAKRVSAPKPSGKTFKVAKAR